jgi:hypothetical protein
MAVLWLLLQNLICIEQNKAITQKRACIINVINILAQRQKEILSGGYRAC